MGKVWIGASFVGGGGHELIYMVDLHNKIARLPRNLVIFTESFWLLASPKALKKIVWADYIYCRESSYNSNNGHKRLVLSMLRKQRGLQEEPEFCIFQPGTFIGMATIRDCRQRALVPEFLEFLNSHGVEQVSKVTV